MTAQSRLTAAMRSQVAAAVKGTPIRAHEAGIVLWDIFTDLHHARQWRDAGPQAISYAELSAYCQCMEWPLRPQDVAIIRAMDRAYIEAFHKGDTPAPAAPRQALTPAIFDAMVG